MKVEFDFLTGEEIYERVTREEIPAAQHSLLIVTALVKQTTVELATGGYGPFLQLAETLLDRGVDIYLLFAGKPSKGFIDSARSLPHVVSRLQMRICPRNHMKMILIDGRRLYLGSANLTGAGLGRRDKNQRNFEFGLFTMDAQLISRVSTMVQEIWEGAPCAKCRTKRLCRMEHERLSLALASG